MSSIGTNIVAIGKNFKANGYPSVYSWQRHIDAGNITNTTVQAALKIFHQAFDAAGFFDKFYFAYLFGNGALADSINLVDPTKYQIIFNNDNSAQHTSAGWTPDGTNARYGKTGFYLDSTVDLTHFGMHVFTMTQETQGSVTKMLMGSFSSTTGNSHSLLLNWNGNGARRVGISQYPSPVNAFAAGGTTGTGLLEGFRVGNDVKLAQAGIQVGSTVVETATPTLSGANQLYLGATTDLASANYSTATQRFAGITKGTWTLTESLALKAMIEAYNLAVA